MNAPSHRIEQVNATIRQELDRVLARTFEVPSGCLVTIEDVQTTTDLKQAKIFVSLYPLTRSKEILKQLQTATPMLQKELAKRLLLRSLPKLAFVADAREERADRITRLLDQKDPE